MIIILLSLLLSLFNFTEQHYNYNTDNYDIF